MLGCRDNLLRVAVADAGVAPQTDSIRFQSVLVLSRQCGSGDCCELCCCDPNGSRERRRLKVVRSKTLNHDEIVVFALLTKCASKTC